MKIEDGVYGVEEINEPVLIDLINSKAVQRLKGINQQGVPPAYGEQPFFTRFDHSIGVMILIKKLGGDIKEQIAGLIHDVSHTAFSHLVDWIYGDPNKQKHQDDKYVEVLKSSDIPEILKRHGFEEEEFYDLDKYTLLELDAPELCADRIDYTLRDILAYGGGIVVEDLIDKLIEDKGKIVFSTKQAAYNFAHEYVSLQRYSWGDGRNNARYVLFAQVLKEAIKKDIIEKKDFDGSDQNILDKLHSADNGVIKEKLGLLRKGFLMKYVEDSEIDVGCKFRYVNPKILVGGRQKKLSEVDFFYKKYLDLQRKHFLGNMKVEVFER
jgi:uncharacterized protein